MGAPGDGQGGSGNTAAGSLTTRNLGREDGFGHATFKQTFWESAVMAVEVRRIYALIRNKLQQESEAARSAGVQQTAPAARKNRTPPWAARARAAKAARRKARSRKALQGTGSSGPRRECRAEW